MFFEKARRGCRRDPDDRDRQRQRDADADADADAVRHGDARGRRHDRFDDHDARGRGHPVSRTFRILLVAVVALGAVGGYWKLVARAQARARPPSSSSKVAVQQAQLAQTQSLIATYHGARDAYETNYATVVRLGKAVPTDDDTRSLRGPARRRREAQRRRTSTPSTSTAAGAAPTARPSSRRAPINAGAFSAMPFSFSFNGDFKTLGNFFARLERFVSLKGDTDRRQRPPAARGEHLAGAGRRTAGRR